MLTQKQWETLTNPRVYACANCGSTDIEWIGWIDANTGRANDSEPPDGDRWCPTCEEHRFCVVQVDVLTGGWRPFDIGIDELGEAFKLHGRFANPKTAGVRLLERF